MNQESLETLRITQQVLKYLTLAIAAAGKIELGPIGEILEGAAAETTLDPMAREMFADLARGLIGLHAAATGQIKQ